MMPLLVFVFMSCGLAQTLPGTAPNPNGGGGGSDTMIFEYEPGDFSSSNFGLNFNNLNSNFPPLPLINGVSPNFGANNSPLLVAPPGFGGFPSTNFGAVPSSSLGAVSSNTFGNSFGNNAFSQPTSPPEISPLEQFLVDSGCKKGCEDKNFICSTMKTKCGRGLKGVITQQVCPRTCGTCQPCPLMAKACVANGSCRDRLYNCKILAGMGMCVSHKVSQWIRRMCLQSCGECLPCPKPTDPGPECSPFCRDSVRQCPQWATRHQYCNDATYMPWMQENCKKSCGKCRVCEPPSPPTMLKRGNPPSPKGRSLQTEPPQKLKASPNQRNFAPIRPLFSRNFSPARIPISTSSFPSTSPPIIKTVEPITPVGVVATSGSPGATKIPSAVSHFSQQTVAVLEVDPFHEARNDSTYERSCVRSRVQSESVEDRCLDVHNYYRCLHGVRPLQYSQFLATSAQRHALLLAREKELSTPISAYMTEFLDHHFIEENIGISEDSKNYDVDQAVTSWYGEGLGNSFGNKKDFETPNHFVRFMRRDAFSVGCGVNPLGNRTVVVVHYFASQMDPIDIKIPKPIKDCSASCSIGSCSSYTDDTSLCKCIGNGGPISVPVCKTRCVAKCIKPNNFQGRWRATCEGKRLCSCSYTSNLKRNFSAGAWCI